MSSSSSSRRTISILLKRELFPSQYPVLGVKRKKNTTPSPSPLSKDFNFDLEPGSPLPPDPLAFPFPQQALTEEVGEIEDEWDELERRRRELPIMAEEHSIIEAVLENQVIIVCGETGSGKTTQVPQFLFEHGFGSAKHNQLIGVTQPRRVAAFSMAQRVAEEMRVPFGSKVSYQMRYSNNVSPETRVKFQTDGILLREIQDDFLLRKYEVIIIDEAHERNLNTDILIGLLSRIVKLRAQLAKENPLQTRELKLLIMSATLRVSEFVNNKRLFPTEPPPPIINVQARQFPVTVHFNRKTPEHHNYLQEVYKKVTAIHTKLPSGGILIFLTGQQEIDQLCQKLRRKFGRRRKKKVKPQERDGDQQQKTADDDKEKEDEAESEGQGDDENNGVHDKVRREKEHGVRVFDDVDERMDQIKVFDQLQWDDFDEMEKDEADEEGEEEEETILLQSDPNSLITSSTPAASEEEEQKMTEGDEQEEKEKEKEEEEEKEEKEIPLMYVLPLYSALSLEKQAQVFRAPPAGHRLVVVATNVAETSLTIPNIKYVVDSGKVKEKHYDKETGIYSFCITWISQASANQRAGRAGRTGPGHCYRLYSSAVFNDMFSKFSDPEINRIPIEGVILQMKSMGINNISSFPYPTPPDRSGLTAAFNTLFHLGALTLSSHSHQNTAGVPSTSTSTPSSSSSVIVNEENYNITDLGRILSTFPVAPRHAKMLLLGKEGGCLPYIVAIVAALSVSDPLRREISQISNGEWDQQISAVAGQADDKSGMDDNNKTKPSVTPDAISDKEIEEKEKQATKEQKKAMSEAQEMFCHRRSDLLSILKAVGALDYSSSPNTFCSKYFLDYKVMKEIDQLKKQLSSLLNSFDSDYFPEKKLKSKLPPPTKNQEAILLQAVTSGFVDQIARRVPPHLLSTLVANQHVSMSKQYPPYQCCMTNQIVYIHPSSFLIGRNYPEFVCYKELFKPQRGNRVYMKCVSEVNPDWLFTLSPNLVRNTDPVDLPPPRYDEREDKVKCCIKPTYGPSDWSLPVRETDFPRSDAFLYKYFARFLLEGKIITFFKDLEAELTTRPVGLTSKDQILPVNLYKISLSLQQSKICSKKALVEAWKSQKNYLVEEIACWYVKKSADTIKASLSSYILSLP